MAIIYAKLLNQYKDKYQTVISAIFEEQDEFNQVLDETELIIKLNLYHNLTEFDVDNFVIKSALQQQI